MKGIPGTGPFSHTRKGIEYKMIGGRVHKNDAELMFDRLKAEGTTLTAFMCAIVEAYLVANPQIIGIVADWKRRNKIKPEKKERFTFSRRERAKIAEKIAGSDGSDDGEEA